MLLIANYLNLGTSKDYSTFVQGMNLLKNTNIKYLLTVTILLFTSIIVKGQNANDVCTDAHTIILSNGYGCIGGTTVDADDDVPDGSLTNGTCPNYTQGNEVWFSYVAEETLQNITLTPQQNFGNAQISVYSDNCTYNNYITCGSYNGTTTASLAFQTTVGKKIYFSVSSHSANEGSFIVCIQNTSETPEGGNDCTTATKLCDKATLEIPVMTNYTSSGLQLPCNANGGVQNPVRQDIWFTFRATKSGTLEFTGFPLNDKDAGNGGTEFDWGIYDITNGCTGTEVACNYNFTLGNSSPFGISSNKNNFKNPDEFEDPINVAEGRKYALIIDNYSADNTGFILEWGGTFEIGPVAEFDITEKFDCYSLTTNFANNSIGTFNSYQWDFGDGSTSTNKIPNQKTYSGGGNYVVSLTATDPISGCTSLKTDWVTVSDPQINPEEINFDLCAGDSTNLNTNITTTLLATPQNFSSNPNVFIPDDNTFFQNNIDVQNIVPTTVENGSVVKVCVDLKHIELDQMALILESPSGSQCKLFGQGDLSGANLSKTCFTMNASNSITTGTAPYSGSFLPIDDFSVFNGSNINGDWKLLIRDYVSGSIGLLNSWEIFVTAENGYSFTWSPTNYMEDPLLESPKIVIPDNHTTRETIVYTLLLEDRLGCTTAQNFTVDIYAKAYAGRDTTIYLCEGEPSIDLKPFIPGDEQDGGSWKTENWVPVSSVFSTPTATAGQWYERHYIINGTGECGKDTSTISIFVEELPTVTFDYPSPVCETATFDLEITINGGSAPYEMKLDNNGKDSVYTINTNTIIIPVEVENIGPITVEYIQSLGGSQCVNQLNETLQISIKDYPKMSVDSIVCNDINTEYVVYLDISGGDPNTTRVNGQLTNQGKLSSAPIPSGNSFLFQAQDDNMCYIDSLEVTRKCDCTSDAGTFTISGNLSICEDDTILLYHNQDHFEDGNDVTHFLLHTQPAPGLGMVLDTLPYSTSVNLFHLMSNGLQFGVPYYFTAITGDENGNTGYVDLSDPNSCNSYSSQLQLTFGEVPNVIISLDNDSVCAGKEIAFTFTFSKGTPPYSILDDNGNTLFASNSNNATWVIEIQNDTNITFDQVSSGNGCANDIQNWTNIPIKTLYAPTISNITYNCDSVNSNYTVSFEINGGDPSTYDFISGERGSITGNIYTSDPITSGVPYTVLVFDQYACDTTEVTGSFMCPCDSRSATVSTSSGIVEVCQSDTAWVPVFDNNGDGTPDGYVGDANDTLSYVLLDNPSDTNNFPVNPIDINSEPFFTFNGGTMVTGVTYYITSVAGDKDPATDLVKMDLTCIDFNNLVPIRFISPPNIFTQAGNLEVCDGESTSVSINITGNQSISFTVKGSDGFNNSYSFTQGNQSINITPSTPGSLNTYWVDTLSNIIQDGTFPNQCKGSWLGDTIKIRNIALPNVDLGSGSIKICEGETVNLPVTITGEDNIFFDIDNGGGTYNSPAGTYPNLISLQPNNKTTYSAINVYSQSTAGKICNGSGLGSITVDVHTLPTAQIIPSATVICEADTLLLDFLATGSGEFDLYYGVNGNSTSITSTGGNFPQDSVVLNTNSYISLDSIQDGFISDISAKRCSNNIADTIFITTKVLPTGSFINSNPTEICEGEEVTLAFDFDQHGPFNFDLVDSTTGTTTSFSNVQFNFSTNITLTDTAQFYIMNLVDVNGCTAQSNSSSLLVPVNLNPVVSFVPNRLDSCIPLNIQLTNTTDPTYTSTCKWWADGTILFDTQCPQTQYQFTEVGTHEIALEVTSYKGCVGSNAISNFEVHPNPQVDFDINPSILTEESNEALLINNTPNSSQAMWIVGDEDIFIGDRVNYTFPRLAGEYKVTLIVNSIHNCTDSLTKFINLVGTLRAYIPNAFTPDGDGLNDTWKPIFSGHSEQGYILQVFNRWGEVIFETTQVNEDWDGTYLNNMVPSGDYAIRVKVQNKDETKSEVFFGKVTLLR